MPDTDNGSGSGRGEISPADREAIRKRAAEIGDRLDAVKARREPESAAPPGAKGAGYALAFRFAADLIIGVAVGGFIGWALDRLFGTAPWLMVLFLMFGFAAGVSNVIRSARKLQARNEAAQRAAPSVADDDGEV